VLFSRPGVGAVTLALLFGLFNLTYGLSQIVIGVQTRRTGPALPPDVQDQADTLSDRR
jgi:hypothetical protein